MKKAAVIALLPLLFSTTAHAQNAVALCSLYQMRANSPDDVIRIPAPADAPQLTQGGGLVEIHKDGKVTSNGQDITAATTTLCASAPKPGAEEAGMHGEGAASSGSEMPAKHVVRHKRKSTPKNSANTATGSDNDITASPSMPGAPAQNSSGDTTSGTMGQLPVGNNGGAAGAGAMTAPTGTGAQTEAPAATPSGNSAGAGSTGMLAPKAPSSTSGNSSLIAPTQAVPAPPPGASAVAPGTPQPSPDQHQEKAPTAPPAR